MDWHSIKIEFVLASTINNEPVLKDTSRICYCIRENIIDDVILPSFPLFINYYKPDSYWFWSVKIEVIR